MKNINIRELVLEILIRVERQESYLNILMPYYFNQYMLNKKDKALIQEISYGVTRYRKKLDWVIDQFLEKQDKKLSITIRNILRIGVYQIIHLSKIPDYAICNESVELVKRSHEFKKSKLVNAVLRNIIRSPNDIVWPDIDRDPNKYISVFYSYPEFLVNKWVKRFGKEICVKICQAGNEIPAITIRINPLKINIEDLKLKLKELKIEFKDSQYLNREALIVNGFPDIGSSQLWIDGFFSVQDESSMLAAKLLNPSPGETVIDTCSGPGGKTTHLAQMMCNQGDIIAFEKHKRRLNMVIDECTRLGVKIVHPVLHDSSQLSQEYINKADKIIVDVPCSGTGVIRKKPDLKWRRMDNKWFKKINQDQKTILQVASRYLKTGGEIVYSTCSLEKEENDEIIKSFLKINNEFVIQDTHDFIRNHHILQYNTEIEQAIQLIPGYSGNEIDGFYMVKMQKIK